MDKEKLDSIEYDIKNCRNCFLFNTRKNTVPGDFPISSNDILFIGESPSVEDDDAGRPMMGPHRKLFYSIIKEILDIDKNNIAITYFAKCITYELKKQTRPNEKTLLWCSSYLYEQIDVFNPKLIITLGYIPFFVFKNHEKITFKWKAKDESKDNIGKLHKTKSLTTGKEYSYIPIYNPHAWKVNKKYRDASIYGLFEAKKFLESLK